jgi:hypothetical protein
MNKRSVVMSHGVFVVLVGLFVLAQGTNGDSFLISQPAPTSKLIWSIIPDPANPTANNAGYITDMAIEKGGTPWIMDSKGVSYWDGKEFRHPSGEKLVSGTYADRLLGGGDRDLYALQRGNDMRSGKVYRLSDGEAIYITDYYRENDQVYPAFYVSKSGKLYNWGYKFLAVYSDGKWKRMETTLGGAIIFDTGDVVYFYMNGILCSADRNDNLTQRDVDIPFKVDPNRYLGDRGAMWGKASAIILNYSSSSLCTFDLKSGRVIPVPPQVKQKFVDKEFYDVFPALDGSVWILIYDHTVYNYCFYQLKRNGEISGIRETENLAWDNGRIAQYPKTVLSASDGSIWFAQTRSGLARWKDGKMTNLSWKEGLPMPDIKWMFEGRDGKIWAATDQEVYSVNPQSVSEVESPEWSRWQEVITSHCAPVVDSEGGIWCFLEDHPEEISKWNGTTWTHVRAPVAQGKHFSGTGPGIADDLGHVLFGVQIPDSVTWDVSLDGVTEYPNVKQALAAAVERGAKSFDTGYYDVGCAVSSDGHVLFGDRHMDGGLHMYDSKGWARLFDIPYLSHIVQSDLNGPLISHSDQTYDYYDRGQFRKLEMASSPKLMLGPTGLQPYEEGMLKNKSDRYIPVEYDGHGKVRIVKYTGQAGTRKELGDEIVISQFGPIMSTKSPMGGLWTCPEYTNGPYRIVGSSVIKCDFAGTPLQGLEARCLSIFDDSAGNTWIDAGNYGGYRHLFMRKAVPQILTVGEIPATCGQTLNIKLAEQSGVPNDSRLFWKVGDGQWQGGDAGNGRVLFTSSGEQRVSVMAVDKMGSQVAKNLTFTVDVSFEITPVLKKGTDVLAPKSKILPSKERTIESLPEAIRQLFK